MSGNYRKEWFNVELTSTSRSCCKPFYPVWFTMVFNFMSCPRKFIARSPPRVGYLDQCNYFAIKSARGTLSAIFTYAGQIRTDLV